MTGRSASTSATTGTCVSEPTILDDPVAGLRLAALRDVDTPPERFREHARHLGALLAREALRDLPARRTTVRTPMGTAPALLPAAPVVAVPVLRAGLGLLPGVHDVMPTAAVGMVGLERDEETHRARRYYRRFPALEGAWVLLLEPMLATGGSAAAALAELGSQPATTTVLSVVAAPAALERLAREQPGARVVTAALDEGLDEHAFIVPGLGDFGDRVMGTA
jgi:uracil phosphoribosyltransferase